MPGRGAVRWWTVAAWLATVAAGTYEDLRDLGVSCWPDDSCHRNATRARDLVEPHLRSCACDLDCSLYGDCCVDAPARFFMKDTQQNFECRLLKQYGGIYMKTSCPQDWIGSTEIRNLCEVSSLQSTLDPLSDLPVSNQLTGITYLNSYCAHCHNDTSDAILWIPRINCPAIAEYNHTYRNVTVSYVMRHLVFDREQEDWGVWMWDEGALTFHFCAIEAQMPLPIESKVRKCKKYENWDKCNIKQLEYQELCNSYQAIIYYYQRAFRNVHCAMCSDSIDPRDLQCKPIYPRGGLEISTFAPESFAILLDINFHKGDKVSINMLCRDDQFYDPFFKMCRQNVCGLIGTKYEQGNCLPIVEENVSQIVYAFEEKYEEVNITIANKTQTYKPNNDTNAEIDITDVTKAEDTIFSTEVSTTSEISISDREQEQESGIQILSATLPTEDISSTENDSSTEENLLSQKYNDDFLKCLLKSKLTPEQFVDLENRSIFVPIYNRLYDPDSFIRQETSAIVCMPNTTEVGVEKSFSYYMGYITFFGLIISISFLFLHFIFYICCAEMRKFSGRNLTSLSSALFFAYISFLLGQMNSWSFYACYAIAAGTYYFFLAAFFWMNILAFDVWRSLRLATALLRTTKGQQWWRFVIYSIYAWISPFLCLSFVLITDIFPGIPYDFKADLARPLCWISNRKALLLYFATPLGTLMLINVIFFISSWKMISNTRMKSVGLKQCSPERDLRLYVRLAIIMGLTWIIGILASIAELELLWYLFTLLNTLQGLFIFVAFSCTSKAWNTCKDRFASIKPSVYRTFSLSTSVESDSSRALKSVNSREIPAPKDA